ncbi:MAG: hypothetical protein WC423_25050, partial [Vulcanimicrobiota bacterium]
MKEHDKSREEKEKRPFFTPLSLLILLVVCAAMAATLIPNFIRARGGGNLTHCKSELKKIGTAMEMYSTDYSGKYPTSMALLTPKYLKTIPECPAAGRVTYVATFGEGVAYNTHNFKDYYFIECRGDHHATVSVPENYPQYDGI